MNDEDLRDWIKTRKIIVQNLPYLGFTSFEVFEAYKKGALTVLDDISKEVPC